MPNVDPEKIQECFKNLGWLEATLGKDEVKELYRQKFGGLEEYNDDCSKVRFLINNLTLDVITLIANDLEELAPKFKIAIEELQEKIKTVGYVVATMEVLAEVIKLAVQVAAIVLRS